ncbi:hypothetical protein M1N41_03300 [Thermodesulfovibrionales bacterium]|nr:hypothetical protein [Thermodesulfovibrionales bacterium]MCL0071585.1 hypothetical protein [Thermodesulfovibrionales bacterium]
MTSKEQQQGKVFSEEIHDYTDSQNIAQIIPLEGRKVASKLNGILKAVARELMEKGYGADDTEEKISDFDINSLVVQEELLRAETTEYTADAELDIIRAFLSSILMRETRLDTDEIYALIFGNGRQIIWN